MVCACWIEGGEGERERVGGERERERESGHPSKTPVEKCPMGKVSATIVLSLITMDMTGCENKAP